jgi:hypothetical protein
VVGRWIVAIVPFGRGACASRPRDVAQLGLSGEGEDAKVGVSGYSGTGIGVSATGTGEFGIRVSDISDDTGVNGAVSLGTISTAYSPSPSQDQAERSRPANAAAA